MDGAYRVKDAALPADLKAALDANPAALAYFEAMKKQERFQVIFRITNIKTPAIRAARIQDVVEKPPAARATTSRHLARRQPHEKSWPDASP
ncbi:hypothetical protein GCM10023063_49160 [Arthrobacter methylotrophus]